MVLPVIVSVPLLAMPPPIQINFVTRDCAVDNRHGSAVRYAAAGTRRELPFTPAPLLLTTLLVIVTMPASL